MWNKAAECIPDEPADKLVFCEDETYHVMWYSETIHHWMDGEKGIPDGYVLFWMDIPAVWEV